MQHIYECRVNNSLLGMDALTILGFTLTRWCSRGGSAASRMEADDGSTRGAEQLEVLQQVLRTVVERLSGQRGLRGGRLACRRGVRQQGGKLGHYRRSRSHA